MLAHESMTSLKQQVETLFEAETKALAVLRRHAADLRGQMQRIQPRPVTSVSLVGTDGGDNKVQFDPLLVNLVRVVDSSSNEYLLEAVTPSTPVKELDARHRDPQTGAPRTALGRMMNFLGTDSLRELCPVFAEKEGERSLSWVQEYRGLQEWAVLFHLVREKDFATDTIIVRDGPFREKMFKSGLFKRYREGLAEGLELQLRHKNRRLYLAGVLKHSKLFQKYRLALALERTFQTRYPCFAAVPMEMLRAAYQWKEWIENSAANEEFVGGKLFATKFGSGPFDPVWLVDIFETQAQHASRILGYLLNDSLNGFPVLHYPACLQRAHDAAALIDFDMDQLQRLIREALRKSLNDQDDNVGKLEMQEADPSRERY